jgi:DNA-binding transcriptional LysR family regulator
MDAVRLRSFVALAEELHFGRAAARLGIAQPHLSRRIQDLEKITGVALFVRSQRGVELTSAGRAFLEGTVSILDAMKKVVENTKDVAAGRSGRLRIGFIHSSTYELLPATLTAFRAARPAVTLDLREMTILAQIAALRAGEIDVGILRPLAGMEDLHAEIIVREPFRLALPHEHRLARRRRVRVEDVASEPFVAFARDTSPLFNARLAACFGAAGIVPNVVQEATQIHTVLGLVRAGLGVALVPASASGLAAHGVRLVPVTGGPEPVEVCLAWRADRHLPILPAFLEAARASVP